MANSDKNIVITPNRGSSTDDPKIVFSGANSSLSAQTITARAYSTSNGTLSFEGSAGQLFSITNDLSGTLFSVNDVSGIPSISVDASGTISLAQYSGNVGIGTSSPSVKLDVANGHIRMDDGYKLRWGNGYAAFEGNGSSNVIIGYTNNTERMRINSSGSVGIGTANPGYKLDVQGDIRANTGQMIANTVLVNTTDYSDYLGYPCYLKVINFDQDWYTAFQIQNYYSGSGYLTLDVNNSGASIMYASDGLFISGGAGTLELFAAGYFRFATNGNEAIRIDASQNVGIGLTNPAQKLDVAGNINVSGVVVPRIYSISGASNLSTPATNGFRLWDLIDMTGVSSNFTLTADNSSSGTYFNGQKIMIRIAATASITITVGTGGTKPWNQITTVPTAMVSGQTLYIGAVYNSNTTKWDIIAAKVG